MAGERKGKAYEAVLKYCLDQIWSDQGRTDTIFWDTKPREMSIVPDFIFGDNISSPEVVLLVTHSGAAKKSSMKIWRNIGELLELKTLFDTSPRVFSISFESVVYEQLKSTHEALFDGQLVIGELPYGDSIQEWVEANISKFPTKNSDKVVFVSEASKQDERLALALQSLRSSLAELLNQKNTSAAPIWTAERKRKKGKPPAARGTSFRRAISKLLIFESFDIARELYWGNGISTRVNPPYSVPLGLAQTHVKGVVGLDADIVSCAKMLDADLVEQVVAKAPREKLAPWIEQLRSIHHWDFIASYIAERYHALCQPETLYSSLVELHEYPNALVTDQDPPLGWPPKTVWLLDVLLEIIKIDTGKASGFGYAQLGREVVAAGFGSKKDLTSADQFGGGFGLSAWLVRNKTSFKDELVRGMAEVLSKRIKKVGLSKVNSIMRQMPALKSHRIIEDRLCCYSGFDPLLRIVQIGLPDVRKEIVQSCFAQRAGLDRAGQMHVAKIGHTLIKCQSATAAGRDHKKKELCGRAVALRYAWDGERYRPRPGVKNLVLILDGAWRQDDIRSLVNSGWDHIFYADEMDALKKTIV